jgi:hypothetical protein
LNKKGMLTLFPMRLGCSPLVFLTLVVVGGDAAVL